METPDGIELLNQIGLRNARELQLLIEDPGNLPSVADKYRRFYQDNPGGKKILGLLFDHYPYIPESTHDLMSILQRTQRVCEFFSEQDGALNEQELEKGVHLAYKLVFKVLYSKPEDVFREDYLETLKSDQERSDSIRKTVQKNRINFIIMLRVIIDQGNMILSEGISNFRPMFRDRLKIYHVRDEILQEVIDTTRAEEISFFLGVYLYLFFVIPSPVH
ncbi:MAG: hypothetical protein ABIK68_10855 [bacterium]